MKSRLGIAGAVVGAVVSTASGQQLIWSADGADSGDIFGIPVDVLPDLDGDGFAEVLIASTGDDCGGSFQGLVYEYSITVGLLDSWCGDTDDDRLGTGLAVIGDVDGDGVEDFALGSPSHDTPFGNFAGRVQVFSAKTGDVLYQILGNLGDLVLGEHIARLADLDGDGFEEMLVSARGYSGLGAQQGEVFVLSTKDASTLRLHGGEGAFHNFGRSIAALGDVDGDGVKDYAIGAKLDLSSNGGKGRVYVYSGATGVELWRADGKNLSADDFGLCISDGGDIDQDGYADLLCSGGWVTPSNNAGRVEGRSGKDGKLLFTLNGIQSFEQFGFSTAMVGDVNNDGFGDYLIGAKGSKHTGINAGRAELISGATRRTLFNFYPGPPGYANGIFGSFVLRGADFNSDGLDDFIVTAPGGRFQVPKGGRVSIFAANDLYLQLEPPVADVNDTVTLDVRGGAPGAFSIVFVTDIDGTPFFEPVLIDFLDANGELTEDFVVPPEAAGLDFTFLAYATRHPRSPHFIDSSPFVVSIH